MSAGANWRDLKAGLIAKAQPVARAIPGGMALGRWLHRLVDPEQLAIHRLRARRDIALFQPYPTTWDDRYGDLFDALAERLSPLHRPRILSFGCASGEEVRALRRRMPDARIIGMDVNQAMLARARRTDSHHASDYICADRPPAGAQFDAILALALFRHGALEEQRPDSCADILPFAHVAQGIARLDAALVPGGWLAIANAHFRFCDMAEATAYEEDDFQLFGHPPQALLYGPDDRRLCAEPYEPVLFRKAL